MKKLLAPIFILGLGSACAFGQYPGTFQFQNSQSFPILIDPGFGTSYVIGSSNAVPFGAGPGQVDVQLYVALASAPTQFFLAGTTTNSGSTLDFFLGTFHGGSPYIIPTTLDGGAFIQGTVIDYYFTANTDNGLYFGTSEIGTDLTLGGGPELPPVTFGNGPGQIQGFTIITPEPSTVAICGLGAVAALLYRRRK